MLQEKQVGAAERLPRVGETCRGRGPVTLVKVELRSRIQLIPVLDVVAASGPTPHCLVNLFAGLNGLVAQQPDPVGQTRSKRGRRVDGPAVRGFLESLDGRLSKPSQLTKVIEAFHREVPDGVELPRSTHASIAKGFLCRLEVSQRATKLTTHMPGEAARQ